MPGSPRTIMHVLRHIYIVYSFGCNVYSPLTGTEARIFRDEEPEMGYNREHEKMNS